MEYARNVAGLTGADTAEENPDAEHIVIYPVMCAMPNREPGAPKLSGGGEVTISPGTLLHDILGCGHAIEEHYCNYEVNPAYVGALEKAGLRFSAHGENGEIRAAELPGHRFFLATLFQPQLSSVAGKPHPILVAFLSAAARVRS